MTVPRPPKSVADLEAEQRLTGPRPDYERLALAVWPDGPEEEGLWHQPWYVPIEFQCSRCGGPMLPWCEDGTCRTCGEKVP